MQNMLEKAIMIAVEAHKGQKRDGGAPYIIHPLAVMNEMDTELEKIVAVLHDVVEDTDVTLKDLVDYGFETCVVQAVGLLTHAKEVPYEEYLEKVRTCPVATKVKIADIQHNSSSLSVYTDAEIKTRLKKYAKGLHILIN